MPHYHIHITSSDGAIDSPDPAGVTLNGIGGVRALVTETLLEYAKEQVSTGRARIITVIACDALGAVVHRDEIVLRGPLPDADTAGVWRAMAALNRTDGLSPSVRLGISRDKRFI